ncbi:unnamed protein product [Meloidogyne enterolobii]|uniref:Uncharacterized protein n=1 Tax=Meloidogyne enterolobii TaxID=390850 RepID=A0ACB0XN97_MELEN
MKCASFAFCFRFHPISSFFMFRLSSLVFRFFKISFGTLVVVNHLSSIFLLDRDRTGRIVRFSR